jgi:putative transposase
MLKSIIYELKPTAEQRSHIRRACGSARYVYNKALALKKEKYEKEKVNLSKYDIDKMLTIWKQTDTFLSECPSQSLQQKVHDMCDAFANMRKTNAGFPKFKKKGRCHETFRIPDPCKIDFDNWVVTIAKIGKVKIFKGHNKKITNIHSYTVEYKPRLDRYFISVLYDDFTPRSTPDESTHCGIDVGIKAFATLSSGEVFENQKYLKADIRKLSALQRSASRKYKRGVKSEEQSHRWNNVQKRIAKLHLHIANQRKDYAHKVSRYIADKYFHVSAEDLSVKNMMRNHRLAQAIADVAWSNFLNMLQYKCCDFVKVDRYFASSQTCCECGCKNEGVKDLNVRKWKCPQCGAVHDRDLNAAKNIDREGQSLRERKVVR